eukprot:scaffold14825_cov20-Cyclotella_meneghiniana.AAC.7
MPFGGDYPLLSLPSHANPRHNPPGSPPPVVLKESSSTSITVGWSKPTKNRGKQVSSYELWMDSAGPHSQVVETGRQYRFQVRAINNCDTADPARVYYGDFSEVQIFTVRDPRPPLPPSIPT